MTPLKSAISMLVVCAAGIALLAPLVWFTPPRDSEVWFFQALAEMQEQHRFLPVLNAEPFAAPSPLSLAILSALPVKDITLPRLVSCLLGCLLIGFIFLYTRALFDRASAVAASMAAMTSFGFLAVFGTLNLEALPVMLTVLAYGLFSLAYLEKIDAAWYIPSYILAGAAVVTGGSFMLLFFLWSALLLILLDLAPSRLFSIRILPGAVIVASMVLAYYTVFRIAGGEGFTSGSLSQGEHLGMFRALAAVLMYNAPWVFLLVPAFLQGTGPSDQESWRTLLPMRIVVVSGFFMLWLSTNGRPQHATLLTAFSCPLIGAWIAREIWPSVRRTPLSSWMMALSGIAVFLSAFVFMLLPMRFGFSIQTGQAVAAGGFLAGAVLFVYLVARRKMASQFVLASAGVFFIVWCMAFILPEDQWTRKMAYMEEISGHAPLVVYDDDLTMRGYLSAASARPLVVDRAAVPLNEPAFLAVSTSDLPGLLEDLGRRMKTVVLNSYRAESTYALVMISPRKRPD